MFGRFFKARPAEPPPRDVVSLTAPRAVPAVRLARTSAKRRSHLGGTPSRASGRAWPRHEGRALGFLARIDLAELAVAHRFDWLPSSGALDFFYDLEEQPWGFDPSQRGMWRIEHILEGEASGASRSGCDLVLPRRDVELVEIASLPHPEREAIESLALTDEEIDLYFDHIASAFGPGPRHQIGGFPDPVQGDDMELEAQLASNGVDCGSPKGYESAEGRRLAGGAADWRLVLQIDSDEDLGVMWGDLGRLYFWVQETAARRGDFSNAWVVLQCH